MSYRNNGVSSDPDAGASMPAPRQGAYCLAQRTRHLHPQINEEAFSLSLVSARAFIQWGGLQRRAAGSRFDGKLYDEFPPRINSAQADNNRNYGAWNVDVRIRTTEVADAKEAA